MRIIKTKKLNFWYINFMIQVSYLLCYSFSIAKIKFSNTFENIYVYINNTIQTKARA
jgi:hypothetical protein